MSVQTYPLYSVKAKYLVNLANDAQQFMKIPKGMVGTVQAIWDPSNTGGQNNILIEAKFPVAVTNGQYGMIRFKPKYQPVNGDIRSMILNEFYILRTAKVSSASYTNADGDVPFLYSNTFKWIFGIAIVAVVGAGIGANYINNKK